MKSGDRDARCQTRLFRDGGDCERDYEWWWVVNNHKKHGRHDYDDDGGI